MLGVLFKKRYCSEYRNSGVNSIRPHIPDYFDNNYMPVHTVSSLVNRCELCNHITWNSEQALMAWKNGDNWKNGNDWNDENDGESSVQKHT